MVEETPFASKQDLGPNWIREDYIRDFYTYLSTINWSEWWLLSLLIFHTSSFVLVFLTRRFQYFQFGLFFGLLALVYFAESINRLGAEHWRLFSSEQYFDSSGLFISTVLSIPALINCTVLIVFWLYSISTMLIQYKRAELKVKVKRAKEDSPEVPTADKEKKVQ